MARNHVLFSVIDSFEGFLMGGLRKNTEFILVFLKVHSGPMFFLLYINDLAILLSMLMIALRALCLTGYQIIGSN